VPRIELTFFVAAPPERCFDLSRSIELHTRSAAGTRERAVAGVTRGLIGPGQEVTWRARHLGAWRTLTSRITAYDRPRHFRDSMVRGAFRRFDHDHHFEPVDGGTRVREVFDFSAPFELLGVLAERWFLTRYLRRFLEERNAVIRAVAESAEWAAYLPSGAGE
jgi:ligand-binding SRPBCC domain-containing protein